MIIKHDNKTWAIKISTILFFILLKNIILYHVLTSTIIAGSLGSSATLVVKFYITETSSDCHAVSQSHDNLEQIER